MKVKGIVFFIILIFVLNLNSYSFGQTAGVIGPAGESTSKEISPDEAATDAQEAEEKTGRVTLIFKDADIRTVLHTLSVKSGANIVASSDVEGAVSIRLIDVPWETALEVILKNQGLSFEKMGNIIRVITISSVAEEELQNEVFILNYSQAKDVAEAVKDTLSERGKIKYDERTNTVIITDIPTNLYKVREVIGRLDRRTPQVLIEAKIIETTLDKDDDLGIDWTMEISASGSAQPTTMPFERQRSPFSRSRGNGDYLERFGHYLPVGNPDSDPPFPITNLPAFPTVDASAFTFGTLDFTSVSAVMEILRTRTDTKVIANPSITTLDNQEAKVTVSTVFNIPTYERNEETGSMEVTGYTEKDIGIILTVTPHVNEAGDIVVTLKPEVSAFIQFDTFGTGANTILAPRFTTRKAETQVMAKDGQTIVIGGLIHETTSKYENKVPFLGDIPILGQLFTKTEDDIETTDLMIFVTVRMVKEDQDDKELMDTTARKTIRDTEGLEFNN
ncbi:secretin N-terminal domain-containing protein [Candidatus Omnitrophota bacterium]